MLSVKARRHQVPFFWGFGMTRPKDWLLISDSVSFFLTHLNSRGVFLSVKLQRKEKEGRKKTRKDVFSILTSFHLGFSHGVLCSEECLHRLFENRPFLPNQVLKYISRLRWLIIPNSMWPCPVVFSCCLLRRVGWQATDTTCMRSSVNLAKQACYFASRRVEESPFSLKGSAEVIANLYFMQEPFLSS